jgi:hypothetical protein
MNLINYKGDSASRSVRVMVNCDGRVKGMGPASFRADPNIPTLEREE